MASSPRGKACRGSRGDTGGPQTFFRRLLWAKVLLGVLATELLRLSSYLFPRPPEWGEKVPLKGGSVLSQLLPFTASTMAPRTMMSVCSASV